MLSFLCSSLDNRAVESSVSNSKCGINHQRSPGQQVNPTPSEEMPFLVESESETFNRARCFRIIKVSTITASIPLIYYAGPELNVKPPFNSQNSRPSSSTMFARTEVLRGEHHGNLLEDSLKLRRLKGLQDGLSQVLRSKRWFWQIER